MTPTRSSLFFVVAALAAGCSSSDGVSGPDGTLRSCTLIGCASSISIPNLATLSGAEVRALSMRFCRNDLCAEGTPTQLPTAPGSASGCGLSMPSTVSCSVWHQGDDRYRLSVEFLDGSGLRDGDQYTVRVVHTPSGVVVAEAMETPRYTVSRPNGPECEPVCHSAMLTLTTRPIANADGGMKSSDASAD